MRILAWQPCYNLRAHASATAQLMSDMRWAESAGHRYDFKSAHSSDLNWLRNHWLDRAIAGGYDRLMMQDSDCFSQHPGGALHSLMDAMDHTGAAVVGAGVPLRTRQTVPDAQKHMREAVAAIVGDVIGNWRALRDLPRESLEALLGELVTAAVTHPLVPMLAKRISPPTRMNVYPWRAGEVYECEKLGTGIVLIDLHQIRQWYDERTQPCFWRTYSDHGVTQEIGQDIWFTRDIVRGHGGTVFCDGRISTTHCDATHEIVFDATQVATDTAETVEGTATYTAGSEAA